MNSAIHKVIRALLAVLLLSAAAAPACVGSEDCSMPCCRREAAPGSHSQPAGPAAPKPCCPQAADPAAGVGTGCRFVQHPLALPAEAGTGPTVTATAYSEVFEHRFLWTDMPPMPNRTDPSPPETPLYIRLHAFLI